MRQTKVQIFILFFLLTLGILTGSTMASAKTLRVSYLNKTRKYKGTQIHVSIDNKSVTQGKPKGIIINKTRMVSYKDVFQKGAKASCKYSSKSKKIIIKKNGITIKLWLGKRTAYVNGKRKKLPTAPVKVKYIKAKKTNIVVPAKFVAQNLKYKYKWESKSSKIQLTSPFKIKYNNTISYYTGSKGNLIYNNKNYSLADMPVLTIGGVQYVPAKEVFATRMGLKYSYQANSQTLTISDPETNKTVSIQLDKKVASVNNQNKTLNNPAYKIKRYDTGKYIICVPASFVAQSLGYSYSWNSSSLMAVIHKLTYFNWTETNNTIFDNEKYTNNISSLNANYDAARKAIVVNITGSNADTMKKATVIRNSNTVTVTIPTTLYSLKETAYSKFGDILNKCNIQQDNENTIITFTGEKSLEYAFSVSEKTLTILLSGEYVGDYAIKIGKPSGVTFNMVTNTDYYNSNKFTVQLTGNHVDYFTNNPIAINSNQIKTSTVSLNNSGNTVITFTTNSLVGYKIYDQTDSFVIQVGSPREIYSKIVVLDAGHGGHDPGAVGNGMKEKDLNLKMMVTLMKPYFSSNAPEIKAYWTRSDDTFITLSNRAAFAQKVGADIFVSLHMNSWTKSSVNGTEVYYSASNNQTSFSGITSKKMASLFEKRLVDAMKTNSRGISSQKYTVVHKNTVPAVLCELGFISGSSDSKKLGNATYQTIATKTLYDTIVEIFNTYPTGR